MFNEIQTFFHLKSAYFRQFWSYIEIGIITINISASNITLYITNLKNPRY